jgi:hypothetical protein
VLCADVVHSIDIATAVGTERLREIMAELINRSAVDRLAALPADDEWVAREIMLLRLRTLLAKARGDETGYRELLNRYRTQAMSSRFEGHIQWAESMP